MVTRFKVFRFSAGKRAIFTSS